MLKHFLKISFRRLFIDKTFSLINLVGLIIGISAVFLLSKHIGFYLSVDDFQERREDIFAVHQTLTNDQGAEDYSDRTYSSITPLSKDRFPEVQAMSRYIIPAENLVTAIRQNGDPIKFNERNMVEVDPDFLRIFTFRFITGDPLRALDAPGSIVLTSSMAKKYFGVENPMGKTLTTKKAWGAKSTWTITGIIEDYPSNSQFQFGYLQSLSGRKFDETEHGWAYPNINSYLLLDSPAQSVNLQEKMTSSVNELEAFRSENRTVDFHLVPFTKESSLTSSQKLFILVGVVLLLITWINYTNLSGAKSLTRGKEFGVRRVMGSNKAALLKQFLSEALLIYFIALLATTVIVFSVYPILFELSGGRLLPILEFDSPINYIFLIFLFAGAVISSVYPSFSIYGLSITSLLKSNKAGNSQSRSFRKALVIFQFTVSIVMLVGITAIYKQMQFMRNQETGFDINQILILKAPKDQWTGKMERMTSLKNELRNRPFSKSVSSSSTVPLWWPGSPTDFQIKGQEQNNRLIVLRVDEAYFNCYGLDLVAGEAFTPGRNQTNRKRVLVNELTTKKLGYASASEALHQKIVNLKTGKELEIIGVVQNHHHESLRRAIKPQVFEFNPTVGFISVNLSFKEHSGLASLSGTLESIENIWNEVYPDQAFDYYFLDERFHNMYEEERLFQQLFLVFTVISVMVTFLGIFGLSLFISLRRKKEIGVRKVLGAKPIQIVSLYSGEFIRKAAVSVLIGIPLAYYLLNLWLSNFSYRISFNLWTIIIPCIILAILTMISLSFESLKMARVNPLKMLRDE
ncbi:MAG: FtsX-like permease family protein [Roseivirga sp.]|nr:FtsX-like permease family protein [Roseivirga sp.]